MGVGTEGEGTAPCLENEINNFFSQIIWITFDRHFLEHESAVIPKGGGEQEANP